MPAAEGVQIGPAQVNILTTIRFVLIGRNGARAQGSVGIGPGAMGVQQRDVFANKKGVTGAVWYLSEFDLIAGNVIPAGKHAVARIQAVASVGAFVFPVAPTPAIAGNALVVRRRRIRPRSTGDFARLALLSDGFILLALSEGQ